MISRLAWAAKAGRVSAASPAAKSKRRLAESAASIGTAAASNKATNNPVLTKVSRRRRPSALSGKDRDFTRTWEGVWLKTWPAPISVKNILVKRNFIGEIRDGVKGHLGVAGASVRSEDTKTRLKHRVSSERRAPPLHSSDTRHYFFSFRPARRIICAGPGRSGFAPKPASR